MTTNERQRRQHQRERRPGKQPSRTLQAKNDVNDDVKGNEFNERGEAIAFTSASSKVCAGSKDEASEPLEVNEQQGESINFTSGVSRVCASNDLNKGKAAFGTRVKSHKVGISVEALTNQGVSPTPHRTHGHQVTI